jgi:hypothetical protein
VPDPGRSAAAASLEALRNFDELLPIQVIAILGNNKTEDGE